MTSNEILQSDVLDILFENRNKQYGAYALRKEYNTRMGKAIVLGLAGMLLLIFLLNSSGTTPSSFVVMDDVILRTYKEPEIVPKKQEPVLPPKSTKPLEKVAQQKFINNIVIVNSDNIKETVPDVTQLLNSEVGDKTTEGEPSNGRKINTLQITGGTSADKVVEKTPEPFIPLERTAQFPGGQQAWVNFLNKYLTVPGELEAGEKRTVHIRFQVAADGSITSFEVVRSAGGNYDNEVIRVLKKMPKWLPAMQNGKLIATSFTQPVTFVGLEN